VAEGVGKATVSMARAIPCAAHVLCSVGWSWSWWLE